MARVSTGPRTRVQAVVAVLLVHAAALSLIAVERITSREQPAPEWQYVSLWPPVQIVQEEAEKLPRPEASSSITAHPIRVSPERPVPSEKESIQPSDSAEAGVTSVNPTVDWRAEATRVAARIAQAASEQKGFSAAPQVQRKSCKPRVFDEDTKQLMEERLPTPADPDLVAENPTASCIIVGGYPKCVQKITVKPRRRESSADLVTERRTGRKTAESVPSPYTCE